MAKDDLDKLDSFINDFVDDFKKQVRKEMKPLSSKLLQGIKDRTVAGVGVDDNLDKNFKPLKKTTIASRKSKQKNGKLSSLTSPETSNQIDTGRMVMGTKAKVQDKDNELSIIIYPPVERMDVAEYQEKMGRTYLDIGPDMEDFIEEQISNIADKAINKATKK